MVARKSSKPHLAAVPAPATRPNLTLSNAEELERKLNHLTVALWMCTGTGEQGFGDLCEEDQQTYLYMLADLAVEARSMATRMLAAPRTAGGEPA